MAGYSSFESKDKKYRNGNPNLFEKKVNYNKASESMGKSEKLREQYKKWTSFYRANPHRFAEDYFGVKLKLFQKILLYLMDKYTFFMWIGNRGISKSWLIALYCCIRATLYPDSKIIVASGTKNQSSLIVREKIDKEFRRNYPNIAREIKDLKVGKEDSEVFFHNGSSVTVVASTDSGRGYL